MFLVILVVVMGLIIGFTHAAAHEGTGMRDTIRKQPHARQIAESGLLMAVREVNRNPAWRTEHKHGMWVKDHAFAGGRFSVSAKDEGDGDLADNPEDDVKLTAWGEYYGSIHEVSAVLTPHWPVRNILLVVPEPQSPTAEQVARRNVLTQAGFTCTFIDPREVTARVQYAPTAVDGVYVVADVPDVALGDQLARIPVPVLAECRGDARDFLDELALATSTRAPRQGRTINLSGGDDILAGTFAPGKLQICNGLEPMASVPTASLGAGATILATDADGNCSLAVYESGAVLAGGLAAPARRVLLGWGTAGFDPEALNADGRKLLEQLVQWAIAGGPAEGLGLATADEHWESDLARRQFAVPVTVRSPGRVHSISFFAVAAAGTRAGAAIYADADGAPGRLLAEGKTVEIAGGEAGWVTVPLAPVQLPAGSFWLAAGLGDGIQQVAGSAGGKTHMVMHDAAHRGFLENWGSREAPAAWRPALFASFVVDDRLGARRLRRRQTFTLRWIESY